MSGAKDAPDLRARDDGLYNLKELRQFCVRAGTDAFGRRFPAPALKLAAATDLVETPSSPVELSFRRTRQDEPEGPTARYHDTVAFLVKRPGNPFPAMISLGRAMNNDIPVVLETISKIHGYFMREGDSWSFTDQHSTNGTLIDGKKLAPDVKSPLHDGAMMKLGRELWAVFLLPASLRVQLRGP